VFLPLANKGAHYAVPAGRSLRQKIVAFIGARAAARISIGFILTPCAKFARLFEAPVRCRLAAVKPDST